MRAISNRAAPQQEGVGLRLTVIAAAAAVAVRCRLLFIEEDIIIISKSCQMFRQTGRTFRIKFGPRVFRTCLEKKKKNGI